MLSSSRPTSIGDEGEDEDEEDAAERPGDSPAGVIWSR
jgi:hypothetical protein